MNDLERRYRRLLRAYPAAWRRDREDEMVTVLLDAAAPGRTRPSVAEALDLVRAGLATRWRAGFAVEAVGLWPDALAVATVGLVAVMAFRAADGLAVGVHRVTASAMVAPHTGPAVAPAAVAWLVAAVLLSGRRVRPAAPLAAAAALALDAHAVVDVARAGPFAALGLVPWLVVGTAALALVAQPARFARGVDRLGPPARVIGTGWAMVGAAFVVGLASPSNLGLRYDGLVLLGGLAIQLTRALRADPAMGRRAVAVVAALASTRPVADVAIGRLIRGGGTAAHLVVELVASVAVAAAVLAVMVGLIRLGEQPADRRRDTAR